MSARDLTILLSVTLAVVGVMTDGHGMGVQPRPLIGADPHPRPLIGKDSTTATFILLPGSG